jgi:hypothetical protein
MLIDHKIEVVPNLTERYTSLFNTPAKTPYTI